MGFCHLQLKKNPTNYILFLLPSQDTVIRKESRKFFTLAAEQGYMTLLVLIPLKKLHKFFRKKNCQDMFSLKKKILVHL